MTRNAKLFTVCSLLVMVSLIISPVSVAWGAKKVSAPFQYSGYTFPEYNSHVRSSEYVTMSDGVKVAVVKYMPSEGPSEGPFPVIFKYIPYHRESIDPETGELITVFNQQTIDFFTSYGYVIVLGEMRGTGASFGMHINFSEQLATDGKELVDWMADQSWCDGNVGMIGVSYMGWSQYATASQKPAALKAIIPECIFFDYYSSYVAYPGGIYLADPFLSSVFMLFDRNFYLPGAIFPTTPVVDEDGDGELADEIPLDLNGNGFFVDDYELPDNPPQYSDGADRQHIYYQATMGHLANPVPVQWAGDLFFRDGAAPGGNMPSDFGPSYFPVTIAESEIPIYNVGGWSDVFLRGTTQWYSTLAATNPSKMVIGASNHHDQGLSDRKHPGPYWEYFGENIEDVFSGYKQEFLRFLDRYLKETKNGIDEEPPVNIFVMGKGWRSENEWPLERQVTANLLFDEGNTLSLVRSAEGADDYVADFTTDSRQDSSMANRWNLKVLDQVEIRTDKDVKCLTYTSAPLRKDMEITGHPIVRLWASSTAECVDFFVYLEDVDENGEAYLITDGMLRANFAEIVPNEDMLPGSGIDVLPDLPWHGFKEADYSEGIFIGGNTAEIVFDLLPTSWVIKKGHQIRVSIANADWPTFRLHPELSPTNDPGDPNNIIPVTTIHRNAEHPSSIELPVIPKKKLKDSKASKWLRKHF